MYVYYLIGINIIGTFLFVIDKQHAKKCRDRISETYLHFIELLGGILSMFFLIFLIRHKSKKPSYYIISLFIFIFYILLTLFICWAYS